MGIAVTAALLVNCGGTENESDRARPLSKEQYIAKADAICSALHAQVEAVIAEKAGDISDSFQAVASLVDGAVGELRALRPPAEIESSVTDWMALNEQAPDDFRAMADAYEGPDDGTFEAKGAELDANEDRADALARKLGMKVCSVNGLRG